MKKTLYTIRPFIFIAIGIAIAITSAFFTRSDIISAQSNVANAAYVFQATDTPPVEDTSVIGSTEGITTMSFVIVAIIILPIFFRKEFWKPSQRN